MNKDGIEDMRKLLKGMKTIGKTILLTSHNFEDILTLCDEVYEMARGKICKIEMEECEFYNNRKRKVNYI